MKNILILAAACATLSIPSFGQKKDVPLKVKTAFEEKIPNAENVTWIYVTEEKVWEASYILGIDSLTSGFSASGKWVETEKDIPFSALPDPVKATLSSNFSEYQVTESELVETPEGVLYEMELENKSKGKSNERKSDELEVRISPDGKVLKKEYEKP